MGLDMYAHATEADIPEADFDCPADSAEIHYGCKHPNLYGWMEILYRRKRGADAEFNVSTVRLDAADLDAVERDIVDENLPETCGFFFGESDGSEKPDDLEFVRKARAAIAEGRRVFYTSWW
jgi:hypothetical protein